MRRNALHLRAHGRPFDPPRRTHGRRGRGFTIVELLVVIAVLVILVAIVVGVSGLVVRRSAEDRTRMNMQVIHQAIEKFRETDSSGDYPPADGTATPAERSNDLFIALKNNPAARAKLGPLPDDAIGQNDGGDDFFMDGFDLPMDYSRDGGAGGNPVLISAGVDGDYGTEGDNIRSDGQ